MSRNKIVIFFFSCLLAINLACTTDTKEENEHTPISSKADSLYEGESLVVKATHTAKENESVNGEPTEISWNDLKKVKFEEKYYEDVNAFLLFPSFSKDVKALENKRVWIKGFVIPLEPGRYVLSANPFSSCFFCGNAGPESVLELKLQDSTAVYYSDDYMAFEGTFLLNDSDINQLNYIFDDAKPKGGVIKKGG